MDILSLRYFKKVAECESVTIAAQELMVAQPAISKMIKKLEDSVGYPLFNRTGRNIVLNKNGEILLNYVNIIFNSIQGALDEIADNNILNQRSVHLQLLAGSKLFPDIISKFISLYPHCKLHVDQSNSGNNNYDLTIQAMINPPKNKENHVLLREEILLVLPRNHSCAKKNEIDLSMLQDEDFLSLKKGVDFRRITDSICEKLGVELHNTFEFDNPSFLREILNIGLGMTFMPTITWGPLDTEKTKAVRIAGGPFYRYIILSWSPQKYLPVMAKIFRDFIIQYYEELSLKNN